MWRQSERKPEGPAERCDATGKIRYRTDKLALYAAIGFKRRRHSGFSREEKPLQPFHCADCDGWHIGHRPKAQRNSRKEKKDKHRR
jgi:hypothetical protein